MQATTCMKTTNYNINIIDIANANNKVKQLYEEKHKNTYQTVNNQQLDSKHTV